LVVNAMSNWLPLVVNTVIGLLLIPFLYSQLGDTDYGIWVLVTSLVGYYGLLRLSVGAGIMRYVPFYAGRKEHEATSQVISTGLAMFAVVGLAILLISTLIAEPVARFYEGGRSLSVLIRVMGVAAAMECPMRIFDAAFRAREKWITANIITVVNALLNAGGLTACLLLGYGLAGMGWMVVASTVATLLVSIIVFRKQCPEIHLGIGLVKWQRLTELLRFGTLNVIGNMAYGQALQNQKLVVGKLVSLNAVSIYGVVTQLIVKIRQIVWAPLQVSWPRFALLDGENDHAGVARLFQKTTRYSSMLASGIILQVLVAGPAFIHLWMPEGFAFETASSVLIVLGIGCWVESTLAGNNLFLGGTGRQGIQAVFAGVECVGGIGLSILLGWRMGLVGVAWGYTTGVILIRGLVCTWYVCRLLKINLVDYYVQTCLRPCVTLAATGIVAYLLEIPGNVSGWLAWLILVFALAIVYGVATYLFIMSGPERQAVLERVRRVLPHAQAVSEARR
jgi:O-antigen/teichoic acid export membrane protein